MAGRKQQVRRVELVVEIEAGDGLLTTYKVVGKPGTIYGRGLNMDVKPHYGNPGEGPTQVEVHIDGMLIPIGNEQLHSITEEALIEELPAGAGPGSGLVLQAIESPNRTMGASDE